jgi:hypothetical protein
MSQPAEPLVLGPRAESMKSASIAMRVAVSVRLGGPVRPMKPSSARRSQPLSPQCATPSWCEQVPRWCSEWHSTVGNRMRENT